VVALPSRVASAPLMKNVGVDHTPCYA
jgi:hypothetical protein